MLRSARDSLILGLLAACLYTPGGAYSAAYDTHDTAPASGGAQQVPDLYPGESDDVGPQVAVAAKPARLHLETSLDSQYYHTSNVFLTEDASPSSFGLKVKGSDVLLTAVELAGTTDPVVMGEGEFQPRFGYRQQWYDFNISDKNAAPPYDANDLDFYAQTLFMEARYRYRKAWIFEGGFDWTQLSFTTGNSDFYSEVVPHWGVRRLITLDNARAITAGYQGAYYATQADAPLFSSVPDNINDRVSHSLFLNYTQSITPKLIAQPFYRFKFTDYSHFTDANSQPLARKDYLHTVGASLTYYVLPEISVRGFASYDVNDSTANDQLCCSGPIYDYKKFDAGVGINLNYRF